MTISRNVWKIAALLVILSLISFAMISGTFAQYTSTFAGEDTALVAKWSVEGTGDFDTSGETVTLDLFSHLYDENIITSDGAVFIAPGVGDSFVIQFTNKSDVAANVDFTIVPTGSAVIIAEPILYGFEEGSFTMNASQLATALNTAFLTVGEDVSLDGTGTVVTQPVFWKWPLTTGTEGDKADTDLGEASFDAGTRTTYGLEITAKATQIAPDIAD